MSKERYEVLKRLHQAEGELSYSLAVFGDTLAKREEYKDRSLSGIDAVHFYLVQKYHWLPKEVKAMSAGTCTCPAGKSLYSNGSNCVINGLMAIKFRGTVRDCQACGLRDQCLRKPHKTKARQVAFFSGKAPTDKPDLLERMKQRIDSVLGKLMIAKRFATVEPVFANLRHNKGLKRFTLRGTTKVDGQWKLYALMHNIEKLAGNGYAV